MYCIFVCVVSWFVKKIVTVIFVKQYWKLYEIMNSKWIHRLSVKDKKWWIRKEALDEESTDWAEGDKDEGVYRFYSGLFITLTTTMFVCLPARTRSASSPLHSVLNALAPVRLPSPPITHRLVMPSFTKLQAAFIRPSLALKSLQRALPMTVPP